MRHAIYHLINAIPVACCFFWMVWAFKVVGDPAIGHLALLNVILLMLRWVCDYHERMMP